MHRLEGPLDRDLQRHQAQACHVIGYHCLVVDDAGSLGKDKRVAIVLELKVKHRDADAAGYVGDFAGVDCYNLRGINTQTPISESTTNPFSYARPDCVKSKSKSRSSDHIGKRLAVIDPNSNLLQNCKTWLDCRIKSLIEGEVEFV